MALNVITCIMVKLFDVRYSMFFNGIVSIWLIRVISPYYHFWNVMSQNLGSLPPLSHSVTLRRTPPPPLTCDVIYGFPLTRIIIIIWSSSNIGKYWRLEVLNIFDIVWEKVTIVAKRLEDMSLLISLFVHKHILHKQSFIR